MSFLHWAQIVVERSHHVRKRERRWAETWAIQRAMAGKAAEQLCRWEKRRPVPSGAPLGGARAMTHRQVVWIAVNSPGERP